MAGWLPLGLFHTAAFAVRRLPPRHMADAAARFGHLRLLPQALSQQ